MWQKTGLRVGGRARRKKEGMGRDAFSLKLRRHMWCSHPASPSSQHSLNHPSHSDFDSLAKELGTCKQLTLITQQVISLKECWQVDLLTAALDSPVTQPWLLPLPLWTQLQLWVMNEKVARVWFFFFFNSRSSNQLYGMVIYYK